MKRSKEEEKQELQEYINIQKLALDKDFAKLENVYKDFMSEIDRQEVSNQLINRCQGVRRDLRMAQESIQHINMLIKK